jgi:hypothetical protein
MPFISKTKQISWTHHAKAKMAFYKLSEQRVMRVIHSPKRIEEGVAPKTVAMMQPASVRIESYRVRAEAIPAKAVARVKPKEIWSQEIWVMIQDLGKHRKIISAWRYPGMTRPRSEIAMDALRREYREFLAGKN